MFGVFIDMIVICIVIVVIIFMFGEYVLYGELMGIELI